MLLNFYNFSILFWNANGQNQHLRELKIFLHDNRIDIVLITETHLSDRTRCYIPNYVSYITILPDGAAHGGSAIFICISLWHFQIPYIHPIFLSLTNRYISIFLFSYTLAAEFYPTSNHRINRTNRVLFFISRLFNLAFLVTSMPSTPIRLPSDQSSL